MSNILDTAVSAGSFTKLVSALKTAGMESTLTSAGPYTVLAPSDDAFAKLPPGALEQVMKDQAKLKALLSNHVISGKNMAFQISRMKTIKCLGGAEYPVTSNVSGVHIGNARIVQSNIETDNGVIHVIDAVIGAKA